MLIPYIIQFLDIKIIRCLSVLACPRQDYPPPVSCPGKKQWEIIDISQKLLYWSQQKGRLLNDVAIELHKPIQPDSTHSTIKVDLESGQRQ